LKCEKCGASCACEGAERQCSNHSKHEVPDYDVALTAWRCFDVSTIGTLRSENGILWQPHKRFEAYCANNVHSNHLATDPVPLDRCSCGIYCYKDVKDCFRHSGMTQRIRDAAVGYNDRLQRDVAFGHISIWGRIIEHEFGFRAQYAYPKELATTDAANAAAISKAYGIKVNTFDVEAYVRQQLSKLEKLREEFPGVQPRLRHRRY